MYRLGRAGTCGDCEGATTTSDGCDAGLSGLHAGVGSIGEQVGHTTTAHAYVVSQARWSGWVSPPFHMHSPAKCLSQRLGEVRHVADPAVVLGREGVLVQARRSNSTCSNCAGKVVNAHRRRAGRCCPYDKLPALAGPRGRGRAWACERQSQGSRDGADGGEGCRSRCYSPRTGAVGCGWCGRVSRARCTGSVGAWGGRLGSGEGRGVDGLEGGDARVRSPSSRLAPQSQRLQLRKQRGL